MSLLTLQGIKKFYGRQDVLRGAGFYINPGERVGLVGPNGAGKTTIMRIILGRETPDEGSVHAAKGMRLGYLPQELMTFHGRNLIDMVMDTADELRAIEAELEGLALDLEAAGTESEADADRLLELTDRQGRLLTLFENLGGYTLETEARKILAGLRFSETDFTRPIQEFSGGWIMRAVLARLLLTSPDLLLLDEPTNHLDIESLVWLEQYLLGCSSAVLLVSHDRAFLNNVAQRIVEIDRGLAAGYTGNYDQYVLEKEKRNATQAAAYAAQQDRIRQMERFIERNRVRASGARRAQSRIKVLEKLERVEPPSGTKPRTFKLELPSAPRPPDTLLELSGVTKSYGGNTVYRHLDFTVRRGDRIAFLGANGRGKSTLMKLLAGTVDHDAGRRRVGNGVVVSYFAQFQLEELNPNRTVLEELASVAGDLTQGRLRGILGSFLFGEDDVFKKVAVLSGGEKTRLIMSKMIVTGPNLLLLDEPSNHLDIPARDMLEQALTRYDGTLCLISHDRHLVNAVANKVLVIHGGRVETFPGNYDDYQRLWAERAESGAQPRDEVKKEKQVREGTSRAEREARKRAEAESRQRLSRLRGPLAKEIGRLEGILDELGARLDVLNTELGLPETYDDSVRVRELNLEATRIKAEMEAVTAAWEGAALELEEMEAAGGGPEDPPGPDL